MKQEVADRLIKVEREMHELGINNYQCWSNPCKYINSLFGMVNGRYRSCEYGIQSVHLLSNGKHCPPRIIVEYNKGSWQTTYHVVSSNYYRILPQSTYENQYRVLTDKEEEGVCAYFETLVRERREQIEKAKGNPDFEEFSNICIAHAREILKGSDYNCKLTFGKANKDRGNGYWAIVIYNGTECDAYSQIGYISLSRNKYGEYGFTCRATGCCEYGDKCTDMDMVKPILKGMIEFLTN